MTQLSVVGGIADAGQVCGAAPTSHTFTSSLPRPTRSWRLVAAGGEGDRDQAWPYWTVIRLAAKAHLRITETVWGGGGQSAYSHTASAQLHVATRMPSAGVALVPFVRGSVKQFCGTSYGSLHAFTTRVTPPTPRTLEPGPSMAAPPDTQHSTTCPSPVGPQAPSRLTGRAFAAIGPAHQCVHAPLLRRACVRAHGAGRRGARRSARARRLFLELEVEDVVVDHLAGGERVGVLEGGALLPAEQHVRRDEDRREVEGQLRWVRRPETTRGSRRREKRQLRAPLPSPPPPGV